MMPQKHKNFYVKQSFGYVHLDLLGLITTNDAGYKRRDKLIKLKSDIQ